MKDKSQVKKELPIYPLISLDFKLVQSTFNIQSLYMNEDCRTAIHEFYTMKHDYDESTKNKKQSILQNNHSYPTKVAKQQAIQQLIIPCIHCKRPVGSIFSTTNHILKIICGDKTQPCPLHFEIYKGRVSNLENDFQIWLEDHLIDIKENILKTKLDVLFQYITEEQAVQQFQEYKSELELYQSGYNNCYQLYLDKTNNIDVKKDIETSIFKLADIKEEMTQQLELYRKTKDKRPFKDIANIYIKRMIPLLESIRDLKYKYIHMEYDSDDETSILSAQHYTIKDLETNTNEEDKPKIIANKK